MCTEKSPFQTMLPNRYLMSDVLNLRIEHEQGGVGTLKKRDAKMEKQQEGNANSPTGKTYPGEVPIACFGELTTIGVSQHTRRGVPRLGESALSVKAVRRASVEMDLAKYFFEDRGG